MRKILIGFVIWMSFIVPVEAATANPSTVGSTWGLPVINAIARDPHNLVIPIRKLATEGL